MPCPAPTGEFPPTDCAFLVGQAVSQTGVPLAGLTVRAESIAPQLGYVYASAPTTTADGGAFELIIHRLRRVQVPISPDTVTLGIKVYAGPTSSVGAVPLTEVGVRLRFGPMGRRVDTTRGELRIALP